MKAFKSLLTVSAMIAAGSANAALYELAGGSVTRLDIVPGVPGAIVSEAVATGSGDVDLSGGVFNGATFTYVTSVSSPLDANLDSQVSGTLVLDTAGNVTETLTGCQDFGTQPACSSITLNNPVTHVLDSLDLSDLSNIAFTWHVNAYIPDLQVNSIESYSYTASAVPVPAAAWLFGSAVLGLVGVGRRRDA